MKPVKKKLRDDMWSSIDKQIPCMNEIRRIRIPSRDITSRIVVIMLTAIFIDIDIRKSK